MMNPWKSWFDPQFVIVILQFIMGIEVLTIGVETKQNLWWTNLSTLEPILGPS